MKGVPPVPTALSEWLRESFLTRLICSTSSFDTDVPEVPTVPKHRLFTTLNS